MQYLIATWVIRVSVLHALVLVSYSCGNGRSCRLPVLTNGLLKLCHDLTLPTARFVFKALAYLSKR
jgi:hypothetical protein